LIITAYNGYSDPNLSQIIYDNPQVFARNKDEGGDNMIILFILHELGKNEESFWYPLFKIWPNERDLLWKWTDEELEEL